jgi:hypothetical protein
MEAITVKKKHGGTAVMDPSGWAELRAAYEGGVDDATLEQDFGVPRSSIRKKRSRDNQNGDPWLSPAKLRMAAEQERLKRKFDRTTNITPGAPITAEESIANKLLRDGELATQHAMKILLKKLTEAALDPEQVRGIESIQDVSTAVKAARSISGLDKPEVALQLNVGNMFPS